MKNILIIGSGGREHTLAWKIAQSKKCNKLYIAPGNAGTHSFAINVNIALSDFEQLTIFAQNHKIDLIIVGPEMPLVQGIVNYFAQVSSVKNTIIIGPNQIAAQLEGSKKFAKNFMKRHQIPTAAYATFNKKTYQEGLNYIHQHSLPIVLKVDGLAGGKGVSICNSSIEAKKKFTSMLMENKFGQAGNHVLVEQHLKGTELSVFILTDGKNYKLLPTAQDYKRLFNHDKGPNTGGMGAVSPAIQCDINFLKKIEKKIILPTLSGLKKENIVYTGFLFIGIMNVAGEPYVVEYNVRLGDPETQVIIPRLKTDLVDLLWAVAHSQLPSITLDIDPRCASTVVMATAGYPDKYPIGQQISGLEQVKNAVVFHAGTAYKEEKIITNGGRVMAMTALGNTVQDALKKSYQAIQKVTWDNMYYRTDIGHHFSKKIKS